jgi:DNA-binding NtrC family response regulator
MPPLSRRTGDVVRLAEHFFALHTASENRHIRNITDRALQSLANYPWPGNVGQLAHVIWRAVLLCENESLDVDELRMVLKSKPIHVGDPPRGMSLLVDERGEVKTLKSVEQEAIRFALDHAAGCMTRAARSLGIGRSTLYRKVSELQAAGYISRDSQTMRPMMSVSSTGRS